MARRKKTGVPQMSEFEREWHERQAQGNAAMGRYVAQGRQQEYNNRLSELNERVEEANSDESLRRAKEERGKFLQESELIGNTIHIGPY